MSADKRKRCPNFSEDEKIRFLGILHRHGQVILSKVTSHDLQTNRLKEKAWIEITKDLNSSGTVVRTTDNLKKLWQKMKTDAKTYKSNAIDQTTGTEGETSQKMDDPILELVAQMTSGGSFGIESTNDDCDYENSCSSTADQCNVGIPIATDKIKDEFATYYEVSTEEVEKITFQTQKKDMSNLKRRWPPLCHNANERSKVKSSHIRTNSSLASERLKCEREKRELIQLQKQHMIELHALKLKQVKIKTQIMEAVLKKICGEKPVDPGLVKALSESS
ncbi:jg3401 [Pararge aegeria aegeria]|uniref:Regulatory protein zeste n=1 Tax=Pararge aegeria aegeria TaxID=348720 RepID=A0A8S4RSY8_9NEOP|nr:jg3401 [Pararge aegeria aegeria]